ncbi:MAG: recombinase family protein [Candidatus Moranbacteria bacterium]|nr:recombinase family protein [Candidatus Moranbacteria bacterium]
MSDMHIEQKIGLSGGFQAKKEEEPVKIKYCLYARKSTESEERQVLSIDSQVKEMLQIAERDNLEIVEIRRESHSAKNSGQRPVFNELLEDIKKEQFNGILTWAPDRLSRNAGDLGSLVDLMDQKLLLEIKTYGQSFTNSPNEKFLLMILGSQAKLENDNRGINVKRGLRTRCEMGIWPTCTPTGYLNERLSERNCRIVIDPVRGPIIKKMFEKVAYDHWSGRKLFHWLKFELNFKSKGNKNLSLSNIYRILQNSFYYGPFEFPRDSGNWYQGKHEPIITKEVFDLTQEQLKRDRIVRESREFAFTKLIMCGECGSGITADEKYKKLKNGSTTSYIYYGCTRSRDLSCKLGYIREEELIKQMLRVIDQVDIQEIGVKKQFEEEIERYNKFQNTVLMMDGNEDMAIKKKSFDIKTYAKYILKAGTTQEKREIMTSLKSELVLRKNKTLMLRTV